MTKAFSVAIIADAHFHDPAGDFGGVGVMVGGARLALRSWDDEARGPRTVNGTAAALTAALGRIADMGIRHVILAGDYTDDGQAENTRRLAALLARHAATRGLQFFATPGNHDAFGPAGKHVTTRFMTGPATSVIVTSDPAMADAVLTPAMRCNGLPAALHPMARFGYYRQPEYLHWESPFGSPDANDARCYDAAAADGSVTHRLMDASYLVEPEAGLWLLMIDANVYEPRPERGDPARKRAFLDASDAGWDAVLRVKPFLLPWIADVCARARMAGKTLVTVSHYPVLDPFQDAAGSERALFGNTAIVRRTPSPRVADALQAAGLRWHAGGHMHVNATARVGTLTDVSVPSLGAFPPAFVVARADLAGIAVQTHLLAGLHGNPQVHAFYAAQGGGDILPQDHDVFLADRFRAHVAARILPRDWPADLLTFARGADWTGFLALLGGSGPADFAARHGLTCESLDTYPPIDLIVDAYLIRNGAGLAAGFMQADELKICHTVAMEFADANAKPDHSDAAFMRRFLSVLQRSFHRID